MLLRDLIVSQFVALTHSLFARTQLNDYPRLAYD